MSRVLLIEPDRVLAENLKSILKKSGFSTRWNRDMQAAVESVDEYQPEIIIMDLATGGHGGVEFLYELRSYPEWQNLPVIIYSSTPPAELQNLTKAQKELNITDFYYKPATSLTELAGAVQITLQNTRVHNR
jgi:DNA-binding response OmpR family regulator